MFQIPNIAANDEDYGHKKRTLADNRYLPEGMLGEIIGFPMTPEEVDEHVS